MVACKWLSATPDHLELDAVNSRWKWCGDCWQWRRQVEIFTFSEIDLVLEGSTASLDNAQGKGGSEKGGKECSIWE